MSEMPLVAIKRKNKVFEVHPILIRTEKKFK